MRSYLAAIPLLSIATGQADFPECSPNAQKPVWSLFNIAYNSSDTYTTPAHHFGNAYVSFTLSSNVRNVSAHCDAMNSQVPRFFDGSEWYPCEFPKAALPSDGAWFKFTQETGKFEVNQTYTCNGAGTLIRFTAYGNNATTLNCTNSDYINPDWSPTNGGTYQSFNKECSSPYSSIVSSEISAIA